MVIISKYIFRLSMLVSSVVIIFVIIFTYLFFEKYLTEKEVVIKVINTAQYADLNGKYLIFTPEEVFENSDNYYHDKTNADELFSKLQVGNSYRVKVVGIYIPKISKFRNIIDIIQEDKPTTKLIHN